MVQVIGPGTPRGPSTGERLSSGINSVLGAYNEQKQQQQQMQAFKQAGLENLAGLPPDLQKVALGEMMKQQGKEKLLGQKQGYLDQLFGGQGRGQQGGMGQDLMQGDQMDARGQGMQQGFDASSIPDEVIARAAAVDPSMARSLQHAKDVALREKSSQEKRSFEREKFEYGKGAEKEKLARHEASEVTKPLMLELQQSRKNIPLQEQAIEDIENAAPEVSSLDYFADVTGFEPARSAEGAKLKTAIKDFFLSDLTRAGARPNQWIEQQLADALPKIGRSSEANLITAAGMKFKVNLAKKRIELIDDLSKKDQEKYGYVKGDIDSRAAQLLKPFVEQEKKELVDKITSIKKEAKPSKGFIRMRNPETGESWDILEGNVKEARKAGWTSQ